MEAYKGSDDPASHTLGAGRDETDRCSSDRGRCTSIAPMASTGVPTAAGPEGVGWGILFRGGDRRRARGGPVAAGLGARSGQRPRETDPGTRTRPHPRWDLLVRRVFADPIGAGPTPALVMATPQVGISLAIDRPWRFVAVSPATGGGRSLIFPTYSPPPMSSDTLDFLLRHADQVVPSEDLTRKLELGRPLRVKLGLDPTAPAVTLGWAVVLRKLRHFQEHGHTAVLIVGDFTGQVGDPSDRSETRRRLTAEEVNGYAENVLGQFRRILPSKTLEIRRNSEWLGTLDMAGLLELTSAATVAQMLERSDFANRYDDGSPISVMEFLYPLLQGYDSVAVEADVELGGSDQPGT